MNFLQGISSSEVLLCQELQGKRKTSLEEFFSEELAQKYGAALGKARKYKSQLSEYAFCYLYGFCYYYGLFELLVRVDGEVQFHFGDYFLSLGEEKELSLGQEKEIYFLKHERKTLDSYLQVKLAFSVSAKKLLLPIWKKEIINFIENYFIFGVEEKLTEKDSGESAALRKNIIDCLYSLEEQLRSQAASIIKEGEALKILHIKLEDYYDLLDVLGLHASRKLFFDIYERLCLELNSSDSIIAFSYSSYFILGSITSIGEERMRFYKALDELKRGHNLRFIMYEKNLYNDDIDILSLSKALHF